MVDVVRKVVAADGPTGLYQGFLPSCAGTVVFRGTYIGLSECLRPLVPRGEGLVTVASAFGVSYGVTLVSALLAYPLDTIRVRLMLQAGETAKFTSAVQCAKGVLAAEGWRGLYRGATVSVVRGVASSAAMLVIREVVEVLR